MRCAGERAGNRPDRPQNQRPEEGENGRLMPEIRRHSPAERDEDSDAQQQRDQKPRIQARQPLPQEVRQPAALQPARGDQEPADDEERVHCQPPGPRDHHQRDTRRADRVGRDVDLGMRHEHDTGQQDAQRIEVIAPPLGKL